MTDQLVGILYHITVSLKGPVVLGLLIALAWSVFESGAFLREWFDRTRAKRLWREFLAAVPGFQNPESLHKAFFNVKNYPTLVLLLARYSEGDLDNPAQLDKRIADAEIEGNRRCYRMRVGVRVGPILGLMGTLIPMGPALMGISSGNLEQMAHNLIIAFSTTVVGLLIGAISLVILVARQHWYAKDMADIEYVFASTIDRKEDR